MAGMKFYLKVFFACFVISILLSEVVINLFYTDLAQSTIIFLDFLMAIILTGLTYIAVDINERRKNPLGFIFPMESLNGCGTTLYVDTVYLTLIFIPILPLGRYLVEKTGETNKILSWEKQYRFHQKLKLHYWQKIWIYAVVTIVGYFIIGYWCLILVPICFIYLKLTHQPIF
ncbi:MAG: hypothetical protein ACLPP9_04855 [Smithella sp.]